MAQLCPFCLGESGFELQKKSDSRTQGYICRNETRCEVPRSYVEQYREYPPVVVNAVGFRAHGKSVFFATLIHALRSTPRHWKRFYTSAVEERDLDVVNANIDMLDRGELPDATPKNFPRPTMVRISKVPVLRPNATLLFFDTGGECFEKASQLVQHAHFVKRARTVMLLISVPNLKDPAGEMHNLLNTYTIGMDELQGQTAAQNLVVVYTKADELAERLSRWDGLEPYLRDGHLGSLTDARGYMKGMRDISARLEAFTRQDLEADNFVNMARARFSDVQFCIVSALGQSAKDKRFDFKIVSKRILDPLLWHLYWSLSSWGRLWA